MKVASIINIMSLQSRMKTNYLILIAGVLAIFTATVHVFAGTPEIHDPLLSSSLALPISLLLLACWHLVSVTLVVSSVALVWSALPRNQDRAGALPFVISLIWLLSGLVFVVVALSFMGPPGLGVLPQWVLLVPVGLLGCIGGSRKSIDGRRP